MNWFIRKLQFTISPNRSELHYAMDISGYQFEVCGVRGFRWDYFIFLIFELLACEFEIRADV